MIWSARPVLSLPLLLLVFAASSPRTSAATIVDFSRNDGDDFSTFGDGVFTVTAPVATGGSEQITVAGSTNVGGIQQGRELVVVGDNYGVQTDNQNTTANATINSGDRLSFSFDFAGTLTGLDFDNVTANGTGTNQYDRAELYLNGALVDRFVDGAYFGGTTQYGTLLNNDDAIDSLSIDFDATDVFDLRVSFTSRSYSLQSLALLVPEPNSALVLFGLAMMLPARRR